MTLTIGLMSSENEWDRDTRDTEKGWNARRAPPRQCSCHPFHILASVLFVVWLAIACALEVLKYCLLALWALVSWIITSIMIMGNASAAAAFWNWQKVDCSDMAFPPNFLWGVAGAAHQTEGGCTNNNWSRWEETSRPLGVAPTIKRGEKSGKACDHWNRLEEDTELIKKLGVSSYRFSLEWSKLEPVQGTYSVEAIQHYHKELDILIANGIEPMVTLLHFTHPLWFDQLGAFEHEANNEHFIRFSRAMYAQYGNKVKWWCTINEPEVCVANSYVTGLFPPGKFGAMHLAGIVLKNLLKCHVSIYRDIKAQAAAKKQEAQVGIVKDLFQFHPYKWYNLFDHYLAWQCDQLFNHQIIEFLRTGHFRYWVPFKSHVTLSDRTAPGANDFVGLNYYSHFYCNFWNIVFNPDLEAKLLAQKHEIMTDMPNCMYPEGLYSALLTMATIGHPIIVTESGIADRDDSRRALFLRRYLYALSRAIKDGVDVIGFYYWSLMDNFEWCEGYHPRFGLYEVNFETQERTLRAGAAPFVNTVALYNNGGLRIKAPESSNGEGKIRRKSSAVGEDNVIIGQRTPPRIPQRVMLHNATDIELADRSASFSICCVSPDNI